MQSKIYSFHSKGNNHSGYMKDFSAVQCPSYKFNHVFL